MAPSIRPIESPDAIKADIAEILASLDKDAGAERTTLSDAADKAEFEAGLADTKAGIAMMGSGMTRMSLAVLSAQAGKVKCVTCGAPMDDKGAAKQWCSKPCAAKHAGFNGA